jgi:hypothetical protein
MATMVQRARAAQLELPAREDGLVGAMGRVEAETQRVRVLTPYCTRTAWCTHWLPRRAQ